MSNPEKLRIRYYESTLAPDKGVLKGVYLDQYGRVMKPVTKGKKTEYVPTGQVATANH